MSDLQRGFEWDRIPKPELFFKDCNKALIFCLLQVEEKHRSRDVKDDLCQIPALLYSKYADVHHQQASIQSSVGFALCAAYSLQCE